MHAVHPRANHHIMPFVEEHRYVVRVDAVDGEREDARALPRVRGTEDVHPGFARHRGRDPGVHGVLLALDGLEPNSAEVLESRMGPDHARVVLETGFEAVGGWSECMRL